MFKVGDKVIITGGPYDITTPGSRGFIIECDDTSSFIQFTHLTSGPLSSYATTRWRIHNYFLRHTSKRNPFNSVVGGI